MSLLTKRITKSRIFSNDIIKAPDAPVCLVQVFLESGEPLGIASYNKFSHTQGRLITRNPDEPINADFFITRFRNHSAIPGLSVHAMGCAVFLTYYTPAMAHMHDIILESIRKCFNPKTVLILNNHVDRCAEGLSLEHPYLAYSADISDTDLSCLAPPIHTKLLIDYLERIMLKPHSVLDITSQFGLVTRALKYCTESVYLTDSQAMADAIRKKDLAANIVTKIQDERSFDLVTLHVPDHWKILKTNKLVHRLKESLDQAIGRCTDEGLVLIHSSMQLEVFEIISEITKGRRAVLIHEVSSEFEFLSVFKILP